MNIITYLLFAITLNSQTGEELERHRLEDTPAYEQLEDCLTRQTQTGFQKPIFLPPDTWKITVYSCVALRGDIEL